MKKTVTLLLALSTAVPTLQSVEFKPKHINDPETTAQKFCGTTLKTIAACLCINGLASFTTKETYIPATALLPTAACIGAGKALLWHLDKHTLKQNPEYKQTIYGSLFLRGLAITAGLTPILLSESQAGEHLRAIFSPVFETAWQAGEMALSSALHRF